MSWKAVLGKGIAIGGLSLPYLLLGIEATRLGFLSNEHAHLIEKALLIRERGRLEWIGFSYPPLPILLLVPWPRPAAAIVLSALSAGALAWGIWTRLARLDFPPILRVGLLVAVMAAPSSMFLATQSFDAVLAILLFFAAWIQYLRFTRNGQTDAGFIAAMLIALGFFASFYAPFFALAFAVTAPLFTRLRSWDHLLAMLLVLFFPTIVAVGSWIYVSWLFGSDPLRFLYDPGSSLLAAFRPDEAYMAPSAIAREGLHRLASAPLYLGVAVLIARYQPKRLLVYLVSPLLTLSAWSMGWIVPRPFDQALKFIFALAGIPIRTPRRLGWILLVLAIIQIAADGTSMKAGEIARWWSILRAGPMPEDQEEIWIAQELARLPCGSVLADDREAFRLIARAGTACPFVLPSDPIFDMAVIRPERFVSYVLVSARPTVWAGPIEARYRDRPPAGFVLGPTWSGWRWYRRAAPDEGFRVPNPLYPTATGMIQLSQMSSQNLPTWSIGEGRKGKCLCGGSGAIGTIGATSGDAGDPHARLLHASGHAGEDELAAFVRAVRPRMLVPVHAERPERWREILRGTNIQVGIPEPGQPIPIG